MQNVMNPIIKQLHTVFNVFKRKKILFGVAAIALIGLVGFYYFGGAKKASGSYLTAAAKKATITSTISASGTVEPVSTINLSFKSAEIIKKIYVKIGDHVTPGQLLAEQDSTNLEASVNQASSNLSSSQAKLNLLKNGNTPQDIAQGEANVAMAQANYDQAKTTLERDKQLYQSGALSKADLDNATNALANADGKLKQAQASLQTLQNGSRPEDIAAAAAQMENSRTQVQMAQNDLAGAKMTSPIDGIVSTINGAEGQRATANNNNTSGGGFMTVISEALQVRAQVNEGDIGRAEVGQNVEFTVNSFPNKTFTGKVSSISPQAYTQSNVQIYDVIIQLDNFQGLKAGMPANVSIIVDRHENALTIPKGAVTYAVTYLNKMRQTAQQPRQGADSTGNSNQQGSRRTGGGNGSDRNNNANNNSNSNNDANNNANAPASPADGNNKTQQAMVLVLDKSGNPSPRRVSLGISDMTSYEVVNGLNEGDTVAIGSLDQSAGTGSQGNQNRQGTSNPPFMGGARAGGGR